ncbi:MAG: hypothetical protein JSS66_01255 [Armatimonadetes bacterium]|nr:hypothetical protein [Armatimonadota bacterium]
MALVDTTITMVRAVTTGLTVMTADGATMIAGTTDGTTATVTIGDSATVTTMAATLVGTRIATVATIGVDRRKPTLILQGLFGGAGSPAPPQSGLSC